MDTNSTEESNDAESEPVCIFCGTKDGIKFAPDPYNSEIYDDDSPCWLCDDCAYERHMDT